MRATPWYFDKELAGKIEIPLLERAALSMRLLWFIKKITWFYLLGLMQRDLSAVSQDIDTMKGRLLKGCENPYDLYSNQEKLFIEYVLALDLWNKEGSKCLGTVLFERNFIGPREPYEVRFEHERLFNVVCIHHKRAKKIIRRYGYRLGWVLKSWETGYPEPRLQNCVRRKIFRTWRTPPLT